MKSAFDKFLIGYEQWQTKHNLCPICNKPTNLNPFEYRFDKECSCIWNKWKPKVWRQEQIYTCLLLTFLLPISIFMKIYIWVCDH